MPVVPFKGLHPLGEGIRIHFGSVAAPPAGGKQDSVDGPTTSSEPVASNPPPKSDDHLAPSLRPIDRSA